MNVNYEPELCECIARAWLANTQGDVVIAPLKHAARLLLEETETKVKRLQDELAELLDTAFRNSACYIKDGHWAGWWDTEAMTDNVVLGDRLVELGLWERHPDGVGRRWFYRPVKQKSQIEAAEAE